MICQHKWQKGFVLGVIWACKKANAVYLVALLSDNSCHTFGCLIRFHSTRKFPVQSNYAWFGRLDCTVWSCYNALDGSLMVKDTDVCLEALYTDPPIFCRKLVVTACQGKYPGDLKSQQ